MINLEKKKKKNFNNIKNEFKNNQYMIKIFDIIYPHKSYKIIR